MVAKQTKNQNLGHSDRQFDTPVNKDLTVSELVCRLEPVSHHLCITTSLSSLLPESTEQNSDTAEQQY